MVVEVTLLGPPRVKRAGEPVVFETRKAMALLALLAQSERPRSRAALCELLYPGHDPERARGALRRTLSTLRTGIGEECIETISDDVALRRGPHLEIDVERFRQLTTEPTSLPRLRDAVAGHGGDFLEGFSLRDSPEFDDWQAGEGDALRARLASALKRLSRDLAGAGDLEEAISCARRWLDLDPLHEPAHRALMHLHARNGDRVAAMEQYRSCVRRLDEELGVTPLHETTALYAQIHDGSLPVPEVPAGPTASRQERRPVHPPGELPLVGRADEVVLLLGALEESYPDGRLVVIEGEPGIGKTRLALELVRRARTAGSVVLEARCHDDEAGLPYGPVVELMRQAATREKQGGRPAVTTQQRADASLLLPDLAARAPGPATDVLPLQGPGAKVRLLDGIAAVLAAGCAGPAPGVLHVDDIHAADDATLDAITYLGRRLADRPLLLLLTWRTERVPPGHRLRRLVADLTHHGQATVVRPGRLAEEEVTALVRSATSGRATREVEQRVFLESEGLPLFVTEYLAGLDDRSGTGRDLGPLSAQAQGFLAARVGRVGETARQVLGAAATIGRSFDLDTLRRTSGRSEEETVAAVEELVADGLISERPGEDASYDFSHQKWRELVYDQMALARRQLLHRRVAAALSGPRSVSEHAALVAQHLRLAGDHAEAAEQYRLAADHASAIYAHAEALDHLRAALGLGHPDVAGLQERIADLQVVIGDYGGALAAYEAAAAYCETRAGLATIEHKIGILHHRRGEWDRAETHLAAALEAAPGEQGLVARVRSDLSLTVFSAGDPVRAAGLAREALGLAERAGDQRAEAQAHNILGVLARSGGDLERSADHLERSLALARALDDVAAEAAALNNLALVRREEGDLAAALALTERALALCSRYGDRHREAALENNLADLHHAVGDPEASMAHLKRAVTIFREVGADEATRLPEIWKLVSW